MSIQREIYDETLRQQHFILARAYGLSDQTLEDLESHHTELVALLAGLIAAYFPKGFSKATAGQKQAFLPPIVQASKALFCPCSLAFCPELKARQRKCPGIWKMATREF